MSPGYLSVTPFCFQEFGSFSLSLFGIIHQVDSLSLPLWFDLMGIFLFLYPLDIPLSLHLVYIAVFEMVFRYSGSLLSSLYCGVSSLWVGLYRWHVKVSWLGKLVWCSGGWSWISFLWSAMKCYEMSAMNEL